MYGLSTLAPSSKARKSVADWTKSKRHSAPHFGYRLISSGMVILPGTCAVSSGGSWHIAPSRNFAQASWWGLPRCCAVVWWFERGALVNMGQFSICYIRKWRFAGECSPTSRRDWMDLGGQLRKKRHLSLALYIKKEKTSLSCTLQ
jgi:hypothetical protein